MNKDITMTNQEDMGLYIHNTTNDNRTDWEVLNEYLDVMVEQLKGNPDVVKGAPFLTITCQKCGYKLEFQKREDIKYENVDCKCGNKLIVFEDLNEQR